MAQILIIDDQADVRSVLSDILLEEGHVVRSAPDAQMGLDACDREAFDVVITDIIMPGRQGYDVILEIRNRFPDIRVIAVSGGGQAGPDGLLGVAGHLGAHATLAKPFSPGELRDAVSGVLG